ncbi:MAG: transglycosylase SLT domain-containing protein [Betaproteobacteria bacterium]
MASPSTAPVDPVASPITVPVDPVASPITVPVDLVASPSTAPVDPVASTITAPVDPFASPLTLSNAPDAITVTALAPAYASVWQHIRAGFKMPTIDDPLVRKWESFYAARPEYWQRINERGKRYLHYITHEIERRGMPLEIALLPVIESAYNPEALSRARALGIWQFIPATGKHYGLEQNWWVDNRRDVSVATNSALDYLEKLHEMFGDWQLALAGYNWGEGAVQRAIAKNRAHGKPTDYASLKIPNETRNYLPKLQAVKNLVMAPENFGLTLPEVPDSPYFVTVTTLRQIDVALAAKLADMPVDDFKILNPAHNRPVLAGVGEQRINLPYNKAESFVMNLDSYRQPLVSWRSYEIKHGETLDQIAPQFGIGLDELKRVNGLTGRKHIFPGFTLLVPAKAGVLAGPIPIAAFREAPNDGPGWHKVRRGESLAAIAQRYGLTAPDLRRLNGVTADRLSAGRKLRLYDGVSLGASKSKSGRVVARKRGAVKPTHRHKR